MRRKIIAAFVAQTFLITACSTYTPVNSSVAPSSGVVRLSLTETARGENFSPLGARLVSIEGEVRSATDSTVTVAASEVSRVAADDQALHGETVTIPTRYIDKVERKRTQVARSLLVAGAVIGAALWIGIQAGNGSVDSRRVPGPPPPGQ
ncbi:MAG: hypothetical protein ABR585_11330 [Gemmatimonadaceae bacterium]